VLAARDAQGIADVENHIDSLASPQRLALDASLRGAALAPTPLRTPRRLALSGMPERVVTPACSHAAGRGG